MSKIYKEIIDELIESWERQINDLEGLIAKSIDKEALDRLQVKRGVINSLLMRVLILKAGESECRWEYDNIDDSYKAECGYLHVFTKGDIPENSYNYCPSCGGKIEEENYE